MARKVSRREFLKNSALFAAASTALVACQPGVGAPGAASQDDSSADGAASEPVTIQLMFWPVGGERGLKAMETALEPFEAANPEITVERLPTPWSDLHDKFLTTAAGGVPPDVSAIDNYFLTQFASRGVLLNLDELVASDDSVNPDDYFEAAWNEGVWEGKRWSMPYIGSTRVMYFNVDMFEEKGVTRPDELWEAGEWTYESFLETADALTDLSGGPADAVYGAQADTSMFGALPPWIWGAGGSLLNEDRTQCVMNSEGAVAGIKFNQDLLHTHKVAPTAEASQDIDLVGTGRIGIWASWRGLVMRYRAFEYNWEVVPFPMGTEGKLTLYKGNSMVVSQSGKNHAAAWKLCSYMSSQEADAIWISNGGATPRQDNTDVLLNSTPPQNNAYFYAPLQEGWARTLPFTPTWSEWTAEVAKFLDRVFLDNEDVQTVMDEAVVAVNDILQA